MLPISQTQPESDSKREREGNIICEVIFHFKFLKSPIYICETNGNVCAKIAQTADTMAAMAYARFGILLFFHQYYLGADKSEVNPSQFFRHFLVLNVRQQQWMISIQTRLQSIIFL